MKAIRSRALWGALLIIVGLLFLLESLGILALGAAWAVLFIAGGVVFGYVFLERRENWWAAIPGMVLLSIGALIGIGALLPRLGDLLGGSIILGGIALSFWIVYFRSGLEYWWAIIPGGVLLSLALGIAVEPLVEGEAFVGLFFGGMGVTFALVYLLPTGEERMGWALIPAAVLGTMGTIFLSIATRLAALLWPILLISVGIYVLVRGFRR